MSKSRESGQTIEAMLALGVSVVVVFAVGKNALASSAETPKFLKDLVKPPTNKSAPVVPGKSAHIPVPKNPTEITTSTHISRKNAEKLFGVNLQETIIYGKSASDPTSVEVASIKHVAAVIGKNSYGWDEKQASCLNDLWTRESNWRANATSGVAYGIPQELQSLHGQEIAADFPDFNSNPVSQVEWGEIYIHNRYGNPCTANTAWWHNYDPNGNHWY